MIGIVLKSYSDEIAEAVIHYNSSCKLGEVCEKEITIANEMKAPIYVYYQLDNFYQNHRLYFESKDDS